VLAAELRDTERAITFWRQKASECGGLPPPTAFDFSWMRSGAWSHRFVICAEAVVNELAFLILSASLVSGGSLTNCRRGISNP
jgi:hypothetical protein